MDDDLENFLKEQRAKVAEDKANLKLDPPYLEIRAKHHKAYDHTLKENIPPFKRSTVLPKEESQSVSLSLGEDYERKKQKLQQELRQDYRCYMAREHGASLRPLPVLDVQPSPRPPSRRDAATLTEGRRGVHMGRHPTEARGPWAEEDGLPYRESRTTRLGRVEPGDDDSDDDYLEDELELMERRRMETIQSERRRPRHYYKADNRFRDRRKEPHGEYIDPGNHGQRTSQENGERKENDGSVVREEYQDMHHRANQDKLQSTRDTRSKSTSRSAIIKNEFATGLLIGAADADEVIQRRKERYRQELQEQIAEQQRNKKREKDLELRVTATGATDPEKVPDRIKHFGQTIVKRREDLYRAGLGQDEAPAGEEARRLPGDEKPSMDRERERLPPELPIVAFQSPLLEYSSALGLSNGGVSPYSQAVGFPRGIDTPRIPGIPLHPPTRMAEPYRSPYDEGYSYYGARNPLDPNLPYYGQMVMPGGVPLMSYLALPQTGGAPPSHPSLHGAQHSHPEAPPPPLRPNSDAGTVSSGISVFPAEKVLPSKESALSYKEALKQQIRELQERRRLEKEERDRAEAKMEFHMKNHEPWGRGGCGAPLRDTRGNLITDLNQMHKENEEAWLNPETWQKRAIATVPVLPEELPSVTTVSGLDRVQTPKYARGSVFANQPTPQQLMEKDKYKSFLKQQIEEKRLKEAEEREKLRLEEEKEERRLAEQRARIQWEYNEEQERKKRKEMEQKAKNEELVRLAEERRKEAEKKKKEADEKEMAALRIQYEEERQARVEEVCREPSPPIPTLQKRHRAPQYTPRVPQYTPRPPTMDSRRSTAPMSECSLSGLQSQSPPVPARRNELRAAEDQRGVISELSALRRQLRSEQKRLEGQLLRSEWEELDSPMSDRHRERPQVDVFDMARLRLQAPVRRPLSRNIEPGNLLRIHESLQLRYPDSDFRYGSSELHREEGQTAAAIQRQADHREQQPRRSSLRRKPGQDYFDLSPPQKPPHYLKDPGRGCLLESESAFINPLGDTYLVPHPPQRKPPQLSARERRRLAKNPESHHGREASRQDARLPDDYILQSESAGRAQEREHQNWTRRLPSLRRRGRTTGDLSEDDEDDDDEEESPGVSPRGPHHRSSADTDATEPWMRPESSETLKRLMSGPFKRERLPPLKAIHTQDWDGPSTYHG